ncbi:MAG: sucrose synthase [Acidobacteriota bacterium]
MVERIAPVVAEHGTAVLMLLRRLVGQDKPLLLNPELWEIWDALRRTEEGSVLRGTPFEQMLAATREAIVDPPHVLFAVRPRIGRWTWIRFNCDVVEHEAVDVGEFLRAKEALVDRSARSRRFLLEIDLGPFNREFPRMREARSIGRGVEFLNRQLSRELFEDQEGGFAHFIRFLRLHHHGGRQLMLAREIDTLPRLTEALEDAFELLEQHADDTPWSEVASALRGLGFEPGWGRDVGRIRESMSLLQDILEAPGPDLLRRFLSRMPMIFRLAILSPHGFFGQSGVLGLPDTGGQVVYILDQVRALEREMRRRNEELGLDIPPEIVVLTRLLPEARGTTCDQRLEPIAGTERARILRVPFREEDGTIVRPWISRFAIWPYLERFAADAAVELLAELGGRPDLIIGNYSDGNLVATLLAHRLGVTQCNIAHALEKTKYLYSDLYWQDNEDKYHFSCQFTADLIAMNAADFIITSTYQEIAGNNTSEGQYESYRAFTMPGLYRVVEGIDVFDPKFNIVSPGAAPEFYFPWTETERRPPDLRDQVRAMIFGDGAHEARGRLERPELPIVFSMARLDYIKNLTGLVDWYGAHPRLRELANLVIVGGFIDAAQSEDHEEREQIRLMHELMDRHGLDGSMRWLPRITDRRLGGEFYRTVADSRGVFVQPARFEAFGLTVVEAMTTGLPTFATRYGGPLEIIENGRSGFHIDPNRGEEVAESLALFFERCARNPSHWDDISQGALARVAERYTWTLYANSLLDLSCLYGFWKYATDLERRETQRYLEMFYGLLLRPRSEAIPPPADTP